MAQDKEQACLGCKLGFGQLSEAEDAGEGLGIWLVMHVVSVGFV